MELTNGKCDVFCNKLTIYFQDERGRCYCYERCYETCLPKCNACNKPMNQWTKTDDVKKYCSDECYKRSWDKYCYKGVKLWRLKIKKIGLA